MKTLITVALTVVVGVIATLIFVSSGAFDAAADQPHSAAREFWTIKHGIKMSAMPAWGKSHDDATIWSIVAFLQKLPSLTPEQYAVMTKHSESAHEASGHGHTHGTEDAH